MTDQPANTDAQGGEKPLFENMDEQERIYAPEEVPNADLPAEEVDQGGTAAEGSAIASYEADQVTEPAESERGAAPVAAAYPTGGLTPTPIAPTRPDTAAKTDEDELNQADTAESRKQR
jgi:hypothetical protein